VTCQCRDTKSRNQYSSNTFVTLQLEGVGFSALHPNIFTRSPEKDSVPNVQESGWASGPVWTDSEYFTLTVPTSKSPPGSPTGPLRREMPAYRAFLPLTYISFYLSLRVPGKVAPLHVPKQGPHGQRYSITRATVLLFIHSFMYVCRSPQKGALLHSHGEKRKVTVHGAPRRCKACIQRGAALFPKAIVRTLLSRTQCHAAFGTIPSTLAWVDQSPVGQHVSWQLPSGYTLHICYRLPRDPG
jgi:hypothetical protein